jgi:hypothetical protein
MSVAEVAIIQGDPTKQGAPFVFRLRSAPGTKIPPHWREHTKPLDERKTESLMVSLLPSARARILSVARIPQA